jgi:hypothetical protein
VVMRLWEEYRVSRICRSPSVPQSPMERRPSSCGFVLRRRLTGNCDAFVASNGCKDSTTRFDFYRDLYGSGSIDLTGFSK